jgi:cell division septum initiation protein DivIVA
VGTSVNFDGKSDEITFLDPPILRSSERASARGCVLCKSLASLSRPTHELKPYLENPDEPRAYAAQASASNGNARMVLPKLPPELHADDLPGALFGYDRYTVVKLLDKLRERFQDLWQEWADRDERVRELELELHRSGEGERLIGETLVSVQREALAIGESARREAQELLRAARKQANRIQEETELEATAKAKELVESAERECKTLLDEAGRAKTFIEQTHEQLSDFLLAAVKWYEAAKPSLGTEPEPEQEPEQEPEPEPAPAPVDEPVSEGYP